MAKFTWNGGDTNFTEVVRSPSCSPKVTREHDRSMATRILDIPWIDVEGFTSAAIGYSKAATSDPGGYQYIARQTPWAFPSRLGSVFESMYCTKVEYEGLGTPTPSGSTQYDGSGNTAIAKYEKARCTLTYQTMNYEVLTDERLSRLSTTMDESTWLRYVTKVVRPQGELLSIAGTNNGYYVAKILTQNGGPFPVSTTINKVVAACNYSVTWHQIPADCVPMAEYNPPNTKGDGGANTNVNTAIDKCLGHVNDRDFNGNPQGTLLLLAVEIKPMRDAFGTRIYDITYMFKKFAPGEPYSLSSYQPTGVSGAVGAAVAAVNAATLFITPGHNHVFLPATRLTGATIVGNQTPRPSWYEVIGDSSLATTAPYTNFVNKTDGVNIYDYANFANLFRPVTWTRD